MAIVENVKGFPVWILSHYLGGLFDVIEFPLTSPADCGFGILRRERRYICLVHKSKTRVVFDMVSLYRALSQHNQASGMCNISDALIADDVELGLDLLMKLRARGIASHPNSVPWDALTSREAVSARTYAMLFQEKFGIPIVTHDTICFLGDNASSHPNWSARTGQIPTFRTNSVFFWHMRTGSWLTNREKLALMAFPVYPRIAEAFHIPMLQLDAADCATAIGNAMHLGVIYMVLLSALASVELV
jgi:hypothetical protein